MKLYVQSPSARLAPSLPFVSNGQEELFHSIMSYFYPSISLQICPNDVE